ncbi:hypothetical protein CTAYLR_007866 [Chrysophaeum taylorii]|uniref:EF-hand domain-containing protein n=1 Tax=Chrysophaeum taylorii TaxID=2483200 RepID=A0AAD7UCH1_9STRA|nr:hypothetical protein CTAYLR_007866 [Chrysophaeum taylorii]
MDPREDAERYLNEHKVKKLFKELGTRLLYERPADPNAFLIKVLQEMRDHKRRERFFSEADVRACFGAYDVTNTGKISADQYLNALSSMGVETPTPLSEPTVDRETFVSNVLAELDRDAQ